MESSEPAPSKTYNVAEIRQALIALGEQGEFQKSTIQDLCKLLGTEDDFRVVFAVSDLEDEGKVLRLDDIPVVDVEAYERDWNCRELPYLFIARFKYQGTKAGTTISL